MKDYARNKLNTTVGLYQFCCLGVAKMVARTSQSKHFRCKLSIMALHPMAPIAPCVCTQTPRVCLLSARPVFMGKTLGEIVALQ